MAFSTSLYTITHPDYYKLGIFKMLAGKAFEECNRRGICGTIGIPNKKSLRGFTKGLGFKSIGQFHVLARIAGMPVKSKTSIRVRAVYNEKDLSQYLFELDLLKAKSGVILSERSIDFMVWRFLRCPGVKYHILVALDDSEIVKGIMVLRSTRRKGIPITVVLDFLVDDTFSMAEDVATALLCMADRLAWRYLSPLIVTLVNTNCYEAKLFFRKGFKSLPNIILPHSSNFIIKLHANMSDDMVHKLFRFENWYFSFADYDIF